MKEKEYVPRPVDTSGIELPEELKSLTETMARNVHEVWAASRMAQGWSYGPERDDRLRRHPCLVPYERLSEEERDYDRNTAVETLKLIMSQGYRIEKNR